MLAMGDLAVILVAIAALPAAAQPSGSTLDWLVAHSPDIVEGRVISQSSAWNEDRTQILTEVEIAVDRVLAGDAALRVRLVHPGGQVGDILQWSPHSTTFDTGESAVFFAEPADGTLRLVDYSNGKLPLERDDDGRLWVAAVVQERYAPGLTAPPGLELETDARGRVAWPSFAAVLQRKIAERPENGLQRRQAPSEAPAETPSGDRTLRTLAAPASPVAGVPLESVGFHVLGYQAGALATRCPSEPTPTVHWDVREFPGCRVPYEINPTNDNPGIAVGAFTTEVQTAAGRWNAVAPSYLTLFDNTQSSGCTPNVRDNRNCVSWLLNFTWGANTIGFTQIWSHAPSGRILESDIFLNPAAAWRVTPNPLPVPCPVVPGIQSTMIHEFGHFVGLGHPNQRQNGLVCGNDDVNGVTKMFSSSTSLCQIQLHQADHDGINYLYTQDLGDLPDPPYPTLVHQNVNAGRTLSGVALQVPNDGPSHLFGIFRDPDPAQVNFPRYQYEWLAFGNGAIDDHPQECEARPVDNFDDGVTYRFRCVNGVIQGPVTALISVRTSADVRGRIHTYNVNNRMYLNGWFDWNGDGDFLDVLEYGIGNGAGSFAVTAPGVYALRVLPPLGALCDFPSRIRLDWREDVGQMLAIDPTLLRERGAAQHGEVEDYPLPPQFPIPVYCHPQTLPTFFPGSGRTVSLLHLCHPPHVTSVAASPSPGPFPGAGGDCMHSTMTVGMDIDFDGIADEVVGLTGDVCVQRSDPYLGPDGLRRIDTEMISLEMVGTSELAGDLHVGLAGPTFGQIQQSEEAAALGYDVSGEAPASTFFDVTFVVDSALFGSSEPVTARVEGEIGQVPPGEVFEEVPPPPPPSEDPDGDPDIQPSEEEPVFGGS